MKHQNEEKFAFVIFSGVPHKAKFDELTVNVGTTVELSWRVNCSVNAPIINYQLEFQEIPHGQWLSINVPAQLNPNESWNRYQNDIEYQQSYTLKGLTHGAKYRVRLREYFKNSSEVYFVTFNSCRLESRAEINLVLVQKLI